MIRPLGEAVLYRNKRDRSDKPVLGIPNEGRLRDETLKLLGVYEACRSSRSLVLELETETLYFARSMDLPFLLGNGIVDLIITGSDYVKESGIALERVFDFGFQKCQIALLGRSGDLDWRSWKQLLVGSQYPRLAEAYLASNAQCSYEVVSLTGAAELYVFEGLVDMIVDAVMTGETARAHGLEVIEEIMTTSGCLFRRIEDSGRFSDLVCRLRNRHQMAPSI